MNHSSSVLQLAKRWVFALCISLASTAYAADSQLEQAGYSGTLGTSKIGVYLLLNQGRVERGHYFYNRHLKDIPLSAESKGGNIVLHEADGTFTLHLVGDTSSGKALDFSTSNGLAGTWSNGKTTLPVALSGGGSSSVATPDHWYEMITDQTDTVFEARVQGFYFAALKGDQAATARYIHFPLRVNWSATHHVLIKSQQELTANWAKIFTPQYLAALRDAPPHNMAIVKSQYAMLGSGLAFFSDKGAEVLNPQ